MRLGLARPSREAWPEVAAPVVVLAVAVFVYTRFSDKMQITRDEGIYLYSALRLTHGVAPYQSIWDPKTPGASMLGALAIEVGRLVGLRAVTAVRLAFLASAVLTVGALYLVGRFLWRSRVAALIGAGIFLCFQSWAFEAPSGPDAKMPGVFFGVLSMALLARRRGWFAAGLAAGLAFVFWQPLLVFVATVVVAAVLVPGRARWRAVGWGALGGALPFAGLCVYYAGIGSLRLFLDAAFIEPATTTSDGFPGLGPSIEHIQHVATRYEQFNMWTLWIGIGAVLVLAAGRLVVGRRAVWTALGDPLVCVVALSLVALLAFSVRDFQNYPDLDPLLPYPAIGFGGIYLLLRDAAVRTMPRRRLRAAVPVVCALATLGLLVASVAGFSDAPQTRLPGLRIQTAQSCALSRIAGSGTLYSLGDTVSLVLADRTNPDRYIYLGGGIQAWKLAHLPDGVTSWEHQISASHPAVVDVFTQWHGPVRQQIVGWLGHRYHRTFVGDLRVFLTPAAAARARRLGIVATPRSRVLRNGDQASLLDAPTRDASRDLRRCAALDGDRWNTREVAHHPGQDRYRPPLKRPVRSATSRS